ncbi:MAG TPA: S8 family serine peptidase [Ktedonobacterales bacterium]|nr:S8 family serine peptidase [Ktedonobacterales bacterium]
MSDQQAPGGGQNSITAGNAEAIARELSSLKQALDHLATIERDLDTQRAQLQAQITQYNEQATSAYQASRYELVNESLAKAAQAQTELARVQEQLGRIVARQKEITNRQFNLLQASIGQAPFQPQRPAPRKPRKRRLLIGLSITAALVILASLGLAQVLRPAPTHPAASVAQAQTSPTPTATPSPTPTSAPHVYPFRPDGTGPTTQQCLSALGAPCYSPEQIQQAFNLTALYKLGYEGAGQTIVILGTGKTTTLQADLRHFDRVWGLPDPPSFKIIQEAGPPAPYTCPDKEDDLRIESTLDVEWSHAIAPEANIVLVVGSNGSRYNAADKNCYFYGLGDTLNYVLDNKLGHIISISYGGSELGDASETALERGSDAQAYLQEDAMLAEAGQNGITVLASTGDTGVTNYDGSDNGNGFWKRPNVSWPASDPYVLAVGGTTLQVRNANGNYGGESVWNDGTDGGAGGGGLSSVFPEPDYQLGLLNQKMLKGKRAIPDVSFPAEPSYDLYASFESGVMGQINGRWNHWDIIGGTSIAAPCWAGLIAIANQIRGKPVGFIQPALYSLRGKGMHDITSGNNSYGGVSGYHALRGYDLASGWGTPIADQFLYDLIDAIDHPGNDCPATLPHCS